MAEAFLDENEKKVLELSARKKLYAIVNESSGSHFREIERKSDLSTGSVQYHLNYLAKKGLIDGVQDGNTRRYFAKGFQPENRRLLGLLRQKSLRRILLLLLVRGSCTHGQLAGFVGVSPSTVSWHLRKLENEHIVGSAKKGRKTLYHLLVDKDEVMNLLITYRESFLDALVDRVVEMWDAG